MKKKKLVVRKIYGWNNTSPLVKKLSFAVYNDRYKPTRTYADWLCSDEEEINAYITDELVRESISAGFFFELLGSVRRSGQKDAFMNWNKDIPVLMISGKEDMFGNKGKGMKIISNNMLKCGMKNVRVANIENARHDILHECKSGAAEVAELLIKDYLD